MAYYKAGLPDVWLTVPYEPKASVLISTEHHHTSYYNNRTVHARNYEKLNKKRF